MVALSPNNRWSLQFADGARIDELLCALLLEDGEYRSDAQGILLSHGGHALSWEIDGLRIAMEVEEIEPEILLVRPEIANRSGRVRRLLDFRPMEHEGDWGTVNLFTLSDRTVVYTCPAERNYGYDGAQSVDRNRPLRSCWWMSLHDPTTERNLLVGIAGAPESFVRFEISPLIGRREHERVLPWRCTCDCRSGSRGVRLDPGAILQPGELCFMKWSGDHESGLRRYAEMLDRRAGRRRRGPAPAGWCSWYAGYETQIDEREILANLEIARGVPGMRYFQIDDGWMNPANPLPLAAESDPEKFPLGMKWMAERIAEAGLSPGIWIRPFLGTGGRSDAPRWARGPCLDLSDPEALRRIEEYARTLVADWGFRYLKFDFPTFDMYGKWGMRLLEPSPALFQPSDDTRTNIRMFRGALEALRRGAGEEAFLLGCNCLLGPAIGIVDGMRIGDDVSAAHWDRTVTMGVRAIPHMQFLNGRLWWNDPDCLMVHEPMTLNNGRLWNIAAALAGGARIASSPLHRLSPDRTTLLRALLDLDIGDSTILRLTSEGLPEVMLAAGRCGERSSRYLALFNWTEELRRIALPGAAIAGASGGVKARWLVCIAAGEGTSESPDGAWWELPGMDALLLREEME